MRSFVTARIDPKAYLGLYVTVGFVTTALALALFGALVEEVLDNATLVRWDMATDAAIHDRATPLGLEIFHAVTQLGSPTLMALVALAGALVFWRQGRRTLLLTWIAAFGGGALLDGVLKWAVHRTRPVYGAAYLHGHSYSFPSGHSMGSAIGYGMVAYALARHWHPRGMRRGFLYAAAALLSGLVGVSRVYLGVHYPSDVIGGWAAGAGWLAICLTGAGIARRRASERAHGIAQPPG
jgi:undecaprenyl-diphosphatase